jgi:predicted O-methyltransferase YrrM
MQPAINISVRLFTNIFWEAILSRTEEFQSQRQALVQSMAEREALRTKAAYNTGSISVGAAWCLYSLVRYFNVSRIIEVGTFIGKSTLAMASALESKGQGGQIYTCDSSNDIRLPAPRNVSIFQFPRKTSTEMLSGLSGSFEFCFLDGRLSDQDVELLARRLDDTAIVALDDFEGIEKGVMNLVKLRASPKFADHFLAYPAPGDLLKAWGLRSHSLIAVLIPSSLLKLTNQG